MFMLSIRTQVVCVFDNALCKKFHLCNFSEVVRLRTTGTNYGKWNFPLF